MAEVQAGIPEAVAAGAVVLAAELEAATCEIQAVAPTREGEVETPEVAREAEAPEAMREAEAASEGEAVDAAHAAEVAEVLADKAVTTYRCRTMDLT